MLLGVINAVLEATRYLPQVFASLYGDGSGALSYLRLLLSIGGGVGATVQKALMKEDISTWFPPLVGHSLEMAIVAINLYKDVGKRPSEEGAGAGDEEAGAGVGLGLEGGGSETTPLTGGDAVKAAAVNRAMEKGRERGEGGWGSDAAPSDEGSDWLDEMPDAGFVEQSGYVCDQMCTNPKFLDALLKYM